MIELLVLAVISAYIFSKLWQLLGSKPSQDSSNSDIPSTKGKIINLSTKKVMDDKTYATKVRRVNDVEVDYSSYDEVLKIIQHHKKNFSWEVFLKGAEIAFRKVVEGFGSGDLTTAQKFLASDVYNTFNQGIQDRHAHDLRLTCDIRNATTELLSATHGDDEVQVKVKILSDQQNIIYDASGKIVDNYNKLVHRFIDIWTFSLYLNAVKKANHQDSWIVTKTDDGNDNN